MSPTHPTIASTVHAVPPTLLWIAAPQTTPVTTIMTTTKYRTPRGVTLNSGSSGGDVCATSSHHRTARARRTGCS